MRIAIDGRNLQDGSGTGTGITTYARGLLRTIAEMGAESELLVARDTDRGRLPRYSAALAARRGGLASTLEPGQVGGVGRTRVTVDAFRTAQIHFDIWGRLLPIHGADLPDVMHWTAPLPLRLVGVPNIYTIHDIIPLHTPNLTDTNPGRHRRLLRAIAASADHVLTDTQAARTDIIKAFPELVGRISIVPPRIEPVDHILAISGNALEAMVRRELGCGIGEFYLFCGTVEPRKNLPALIRAFRASGSRRRLVIAGPDGNRAAQEMTSLLGGQVVRVGYLPRDTMLALMRAARALLYPSLAEGYGLPIIEARGVGTPIMTARGGATAEVAAGAALLVDPYDERDMADAIRRLDSDEALQQTLRAVGRGDEQSSSRPWGGSVRSLYSASVNAAVKARRGCGGSFPVSKPDVERLAAR